MKIILNNSSVEFVNSKKLMGVRNDGYMAQDGVVRSYSDYNYYVFDVSKNRKVDISTKGNEQETAVYVLKRDNKVIGYKLYSGNFSGEIDTYDADTLFINVLVASAYIPTCSIVSYNYMDDNEIIGTESEDSILNNNGDISANSFHNVFKYDVSDCNVVEMYTIFGATNLYALKKNNETVFVKKNTNTSITEPKTEIVNVVGIDELWISCVDTSYARCYKIQ